MLFGLDVCSIALWLRYSEQAFAALSGCFYRREPKPPPFEELPDEEPPERLLDEPNELLLRDEPNELRDELLLRDEPNELLDELLRDEPNELRELLLDELLLRDGPNELPESMRGVVGLNVERGVVAVVVRREPKPVEG